MSKRSVPVILLPDEDGGYSVFVPLFPACTTQGETAQEALENAKEAMELILEEPSEDDLECLELLDISHVVLGRVEVEIPVPPKVKTRD
jgi:predicted RNase H-like HicB family nuclease